MTEQELQEIRERVNKATQGPWKERDYENNDGDICIDCNAFANKGKGRCLGGTLATAHRTGTGKSSVDANAEFIAHAREDVPKLLDEVERLRGALKWISTNYDINDSTMYNSQRAYDSACTALTVLRDDE